MTANVPVPTFLHGFTIEAWFKSPSTGKTCETQQGWYVTHPLVPATLARAGSVFGRAPELGWKPTLAKAIKEIESCHRIAHDATNRFAGDSLMGYNKEFAQRLAIYFPEAPAPKNALARHHENYLKTLDEKRAAEERPSDTEKIAALVAAAREALTYLSSAPADVRARVCAAIRTAE